MGEINPETGGLANQYTQAGNSVLAQLNRAHDQALKQLSSSLAARGALESGATGVGVGQENQNLQQGMSNAYEQLLNNLLGFQNDYATAAGGARSNLENSLSSAYDRAVQMAEQNPGLYSSTPSPMATPTAPSAAVSNLVSRVQSGSIPTRGFVTSKPKPKVVADPYAYTRTSYR